MKNLSERKIEIDGKEYTLFLNRKGIVAWEKYSTEEQSKLEKMKDKYNDIINNKVEISDDTDPFSGIEDFEEDLEVTNKIIEKLYWIMLYEKHKLSIKDVHELFAKAMEEYGFEQLDLLATQMIDDVNINPNNNLERKKLAALNPTN